MHIYWDTAPVIGYYTTSLASKFDIDRIAISRHSFVYGVINDFVDHVMKTADISVADIHSRAFANGF